MHMWALGRKENMFVGLARTIYICTVYFRIFGYFPAQHTVYTLYIYGSSQPYMFVLCVALSVQFTLSQGRSSLRSD